MNNTTGSSRKYEPLDQPTTCHDCGSDHIILDNVRGELICKNCGLVVSSQLIDSGPEWRAFTSDEQKKRSRVGSPMTFTIHDKGLSTMIGWEDKDAYGHKISARGRAQIYRLRKWQIRTRVHSSQDRNLSHALSELDRLTSQLGIPKSVKETAAVIYRKTIEKRLVRGRSIEAMVAATVYAASRIKKLPRTIDEIAQDSRVSKKDLGRCYRLILRNIDIKIPIPSPIDYVFRIGTELNLSGKTQQAAVEILKKAKEEGLTGGKDPTGLAASAIYISSIKENERRTQREIAAIARVTEVTVRNRYKELVKELGIKITV